MTTGFTIPTNLVLNIGSYANDSTGDDLRTAFDKVKNTFTYFDQLYNSIAAVEASSTAPAAPIVGDLWWNSVDGRLYVYYGTNWIEANPVSGSSSSLETDTNPKLGGNLNLNNYFITGAGDVRATVWGLDIRSINSSVQTLLNNPSFTTTDLGTFFSPATDIFDLGTF